MDTQRIFDLEERTYTFARQVRGFIKKLPHTVANVEDGKQVIRSSGSVGANYIEANDSIGDKDKLMRIRICRKEAKESRFWLRLFDTEIDKELNEERMVLINEAHELMLIFGSILKKLLNKS
jgi:four helix bundle protein